MSSGPLCRRPPDRPTQAVQFQRIVRQDGVHACVQHRSPVGLFVPRNKRPGDEDPPAGLVGALDPLASGQMPDVDPVRRKAASVFSDACLSNPRCATTSGDEGFGSDAVETIESASTATARIVSPNISWEMGELIRLSFARATPFGLATGRSCRCGWIGSTLLDLKTAIKPGLLWRLEISRGPGIPSRRGSRERGRGGFPGFRARLP